MPVTQSIISSLKSSGACLITLLLATSLTPVLAHGGGGGGGGGHGGGGHGGGFGHGGFHGGGYHSFSGGHYGMTFSGWHGTYYGLGHTGITHAGNLSHFRNHLGLTNNWGTYYAWNHWNGRFGYWGSWSNPWLNNSWGWGWGWGSWGMPLYAAGSGFATLAPNGSPGLVVDEEGNTYPSAIYRYNEQYVNDYTWDTGDRIPSLSETVDKPALYRLGPDADIIAGGKVVIGVTDSAYLFVTPKATQLINSASGIPVVSLATDPALIWHLSAEMKRQILGLESAVQLKEENAQTVPVSSTSSPDRELANLHAAIDLLKLAQNNLGSIPDKAPSPAPPVVAGSTELFAGAWATPDSKFVVLKRADGTDVYTDGRAWYSDQGKTAIAGPDTNNFKEIVISYINGLVGDAPAAINGLKQDQHEAQAKIASAKNELEKLQPDVANGGGYGAYADDELIEAKNRASDELAHNTERLAAVNQQLADIPKDVSTVKALLKNWGE